MADYMEQQLDISLSTVLPMIQQGIMNHTSYFGVRTFKSPIDAWVYQEIIFETRPDVIIEIGNANGGSTLFLAHLCELLGKGRVIGLDLSHETVPDRVKEHPRISLIEGDACRNLAGVEEMVSSDETVLVIEDSSHTYDNTLAVLHTYARLIKPGGYFIVEDSINHHGLTGGQKPGPYEAIDDFLRDNQDFEIDRAREHFFITWNPKGYLRRKASGAAPEHAGEAREAFSVRRTRLRETLRLFIPPILVLMMDKLYDRRGHGS